MSAHRYQVIAHHLNETMSVWPADGKPLSKKDGQRLATELVNDIELKPGMKVTKATVVEVILQINP